MIPLQPAGSLSRMKRKTRTWMRLIDELESQDGHAEDEKKARKMLHQAEDASFLRTNSKPTLELVSQKPRYTPVARSTG
jgi:cytidylate kinase